MGGFGDFEQFGDGGDVSPEHSEWGEPGDGLAADDIERIDFVMTVPEVDDYPDPVVHLALESISMHSISMLAENKSAAEKTMAEMIWRMRHSLSVTIAEDPIGFDPVDATDKVCLSVIENRESVIRDTMEADSGCSYDSDALIDLVLDSVGGVAFTDETRAIPSDEFINGLLAQVECEQETFGLIGGLLEKYEGTKILELVQSVYAATTREGGADVDEAYRLVADACRRPQEYILPEDSSGALYLMSFIPHDVRKFVWPLLVSGAVLSATRKSISLASEEDALMFEAMEAFMLAECTSGHDWSDIADQQGCSEETSRQIALSSAAAYDAIKTVERLTAEGKGQRTADIWHTAANKLADTIYATTYTCQGLELWQIIQGGHRCINRSLVAKIDEARLSGVRTAEKTGLRAVVLEGDPQQQMVWRSAVDRHTPYAPSASATCSTPDEALAHLTDTDVGLYVLDIEDRAGTPTGVGVAHQVISRHIQALRNGERPTPITVVVWSSSGQAVKAASDELLPILQDTADIDGMVGWSTPGAQRLWQSNSLRVIVSPKNWYALDRI